jgi:AcrR family transcriptional regulator
MASLAHSPIFRSAAPLPRGPHRLTREEVAASQRTRLMAAFTELLAERGYSAVTIGELARRASVSRAAFYEHFADKQACLLAAYDHFALTLVTAMTTGVEDDTPWSAFVDGALAGYLLTLEKDPVAARAFLVEMDGAGEVARRRRREAVHAFAAMFEARHNAMRARDPALGPLPERVYLGLALGVRELARAALEEDPAPKLSQMTPDIVTWIAATIEGASSAYSLVRDGGAR